MAAGPNSRDVAGLAARIQWLSAECKRRGLYIPDLSDAEEERGPVVVSEKRELGIDENRKWTRQRGNSKSVKKRIKQTQKDYLTRLALHLERLLGITASSAKGDTVCPAVSSPDDSDNYFSDSDLEGSIYEQKSRQRKQSAGKRKSGKKK